MSELEPVQRRVIGREQAQALFSPGRWNPSPRVASARHGETARFQLEARTERQRASLALQNLRGITIVFVVMMHANLAYLASAPEHPVPFSQSPYLWVAFPIVDARRWLGLDLICAWQDVYLMCLLFFLSGLFVVGGIERDGVSRFLLRRMVRLGAPLLFAAVVIMPIALYPVYRVTAPEPSLGDYFHAYTSLPFVPCGPMWFLGLLIGLTILAVALVCFARPVIAAVAKFSQAFEDRPLRTSCLWALVSVLAYVPFALIFTPWRWENWGPFALQLCRPGLYVVYYVAGLGVGAAGLGAGMLRTDGALARAWRLWFAAAAGSLFVWMGFTGLTLKLGDASPMILNFVSSSSFAVACACSVLFMVAACLHFGGTRPWPLASTLADNAFGIYVLHYAPVIWLQYVLLGVDWPAPLKAIVVLAAAGGGSLAAIVFGRRLLSAARGSRFKPIKP